MKTTPSKKIKPAPYKLLIKVRDLQSIIKTSVKEEVAEVLAIGEGLEDKFEIGDQILIKTWAVDIFQIQEGEFCFVGIDINDPNGAYCGKL